MTDNQGKVEFKFPGNSITVTVKERHPELDIENLPLPLYRGPDFAVIEIPSTGELVVIDSSLILLGMPPSSAVRRSCAGRKIKPKKDAEANVRFGVFFWMNENPRWDTYFMPFS